jgi:chromate transporter
MPGDEATPTSDAAPGPGRPLEVFGLALRLGLSSFGGPIAHLGYFERCYVRQRRWLSAADYAGLVALCQMLPGPTSSQVGFLVGLRRAGWCGALAAWLGFTLPSALFLYGCAVLTTRASVAALAPVLHGLKLAAVAVVAQAVWSMARTLCTDRITVAIALLAAAALRILEGSAWQLMVLCAAALAGLLWCRRASAPPARPPRLVSPRVAWIALASCVLLLLALPLLARRDPHGALAFFGLFYRAGALVFGGGHVVLPLLRDVLVPGAWISDERFLVGYGFAQAIPGPLFTFSAYLGAASTGGLAGGPAAAIALAGIFLPGLLLAIAGTALWQPLSQQLLARGALTGINAAVVGILGAALYDPVCTTGITSVLDAGIAVIGFLLLQRWKLAPLALVAVCVAAAVLSAAIR